MTERTAD